MQSTPCGQPRGFAACNLGFDGFAVCRQPLGWPGPLRAQSIPGRVRAEPHGAAANPRAATRKVNPKVKVNPEVEVEVNPEVEVEVEVEVNPEVEVEVEVEAPGRPQLVGGLGVRPLTVFRLRRREGSRS
jgi:hypothetical protein